MSVGGPREYSPSENFPIESDPFPELLEILKEEPNATKQIVNLILENQEWRRSNIQTVDRFVKQLLSDSILAKKIVDVSGTVFKIRSKQVDDYLEETASFSNYLRCITRYGSYVKTVDLDRFGDHIRDKDIRLIVEKCPNLSSLVVNSESIRGNFFNDLEKLKNLDVLRVSGVSDKFKLKDPSIIGKLTSLKKLSINGCTFNKAPNFTKLKSLEILDLKNSEFQGNPKLKGLKSLQYLRLGSKVCKLEILPNLTDLKSLQTLDLSWCDFKVPTSLINLPSLQTVRFDNSYFEIPPDLSELPSLQSLNLMGYLSKNLPSLKGLRSLEKLNLNALKHEAPPDLNDLVNLKEISFNSCVNFIELDLSRFTKLKRVDCRLCPVLRTIGEVLPQCQILDCTDCSYLILPQVPVSAVVNFGNRLVDKFYVDPNDIKKNPMSVLCRLGKILLNDYPMPKIIFLDPLTGRIAQGLDYGGLKSQLVTDLIDSLFKEESGFSFTHEGSRKLPVLEEPVSKKSKYALRTMGSLIVHCFTSSLHMGDHLPISFFSAIGNLSDKEINSISFDRPLDKTVKEKIYASLMGIDVQELMNADFEDMEKRNVALPIAIIAKELKNAPGFSMGLLRKNPEQFASLIQGKEVTLDTLKNSLAIEDKETMNYFSRYIDENPKKIVDLVELFTSSRTLGEKPITISVFGSWEDSRLPMIHTCSQEVHLPKYSDYEIFKEKLEISFSSMKRFDFL